MPLSKTLYLLLSVGSTQGDRNFSLHNRKIVDLDIKHQNKQNRQKSCLLNLENIRIKWESSNNLETYI